MKTTPSIVFVGLIGIGKTTLCKKLKRKLNEEHGLSIDTILEPVEAWKESGLLNHFYQDMKRWAYTFQQKAFSSRLNLFTKVDWDKIELTISDGTILMDRHAFAEMLHDDRMMSDFEFEEYLDSFQEWKNIVPAADPSIFIYLKPSQVDVAIKRIKTRDRSEEIGITSDYLTKLESKIEKMFQLPSIKNRVIVVDADQNEDQLIEDIYKKLNEKDDFINKIPRKSVATDTTVVDTPVPIGLFGSKFF
jgi:deoxyadenosine/deoxycytidine kinase